MWLRASRVLIGIILAQRRRRWPNITSALDQYIALSGVSDAGILKVTNIVQHPEKTVQSPNTVSMTGQRRRLWVNIETVWLNDTCLRKIYNRPGDRLVLGQRRRRLTGIEPAMGCNAGPTLNRNLAGRPTSSVSGTS